MTTPVPSSCSTTSGDMNRLFRFHKFEVTKQVFHTTTLSFAFVNIKPLLPGHILISPLRPVDRLSKLTDAEASDLFITVKKVGRMLERVYKASALTVPLQDGHDAGQSVPHVHFHIVPRTPGDLDHAGGPDAIYDQLEGDEGDIGAHLTQRRRAKTARVDEDAIPLRTDEEMWAEAEMLKGEMERQSELEAEGTS